MVHNYSTYKSSFPWVSLIFDLYLNKYTRSTLSSLTYVHNLWRILFSPSLCKLAGPYVFGTTVDSATCQGLKWEKNCQGSFGPLMLYFWVPSQSLRGPEFILLMGLITIWLSPQYLRALQARLGVNFFGPRARLILTPVTCYYRLRLECKSKTLEQS